MTRLSRPRGHAGCGAPSPLHEVEEEGRGVRLPGQDAKGRRVDARVRVGVARVPAGDAGVVVEDVGRVPAEDDVAEAERVLEGAPELLERDVLAAQDAVDVVAADLDAADAMLLEGFLQLFRVHGGREVPGSGRSRFGAGRTRRQGARRT